MVTDRKLSNKRGWQVTLRISKQTANSKGGIRKDLMLCASVHAKGLQKHMAISCFHGSQVGVAWSPSCCPDWSKKGVSRGWRDGEIILPLSSHRAKAMEKKGFVQIGKVNQCSIHETCIIHCVWSSSPFIIGINMSRYLNHVDRHR